jgi:hypothetical protein
VLLISLFCDVVLCLACVLCGSYCANLLCVLVHWYRLVPVMRDLKWLLVCALAGFICTIAELGAILLLSDRLLGCSILLGYGTETGKSGLVAALFVLLAYAGI